jgi:phosphoglycerate dehydrogenase-like enzyme
MRPGATFINTGRGAQVNEPELAAVLKRRPDLMALLDVTDPEPAPAGSAFYDLPNVQLSSHIAGAHDDEVVRMADYMIEEFRHWQKGEPLRYAVSPELLDRMA